MAIKFFNIAFVVICVLYPFVLYFAPRFISFLSCIMIVFYLRKILVSKDNTQRILYAFVCILFAIVLAGKLDLLNHTKMLAYLYPSFINVGLLIFFGTSLKKEAIITTFAKLKNPNLDNEGIIYTRNLTKIWCYFFVFNAIVVVLLANLEDKFYWSIFCGFLSYVLIGTLFVGELLYRKLILHK